MTNNVKNLTELLFLVAELNFSPTTKRDISSAIRGVAKMLGAAPEEVPLDVMHGCCCRRWPLRVKKLGLQGQDRSWRGVQQPSWGMLRLRFSLLYRNGGPDRIRTCDPQFRKL